MTRVAMWALLAVVALAAAVLSFSALRDLAILCGFHERLAWLLPVVVDAGAATGCLIWLGTGSTARALRFARALTWVLLASSVAGNAVVHYLAAYSLRPIWWLVVAVSAVAPAVLGAVVHLAVLVGRGRGGKVADNIPGNIPAPSALPVAPNLGAAALEPPSVPCPPDDLLSRTERLLPIGRRALSERLDITEHQARELLRRAKANA